LVEPLAAAVPELRDAANQPVLGALLAARNGSGADYLITGDKDLLALAERYPIVTPARFWEMHAGL
jgi:predicted nucleic acid-binding protein